MLDRKLNFQMPVARVALLRRRLVAIRRRALREARCRDSRGVEEMARGRQRRRHSDRRTARRRIHADRRGPRSSRRRAGCRRSCAADSPSRIFRNSPPASGEPITPAFLRKLGMRHVAATVVLPRQDVIVRPLVLPGVSDKDLDSAVRFQMDGLHPYNDDDVYSSWVRLPGNFNGRWWRLPAKRLSNVTPLCLPRPASRSARLPAPPPPCIRRCAFLERRPPRRSSRGTMPAQGASSAVDILRRESRASAPLRQLRRRTCPCRRASPPRNCESNPNTPPFRSPSCSARKQQWLMPPRWRRHVPASACP